MITLTSQERRQLTSTFRCPDAQLDSQLARYGEAAIEEYVRMILGQHVYTRGQDIKEYRLSLLIKHVFGGRLPSEEQISALFQTTASQSRGLLRAVMSKFQYELKAAIYASLRDAVHAATPPQEGGPIRIECDSENVVEALNRIVARIDATLPPITRTRGTVSAYDIPSSTHSALLIEMP